MRFVLLGTIAAVTAAHLVTFNNLAPRLDTNGIIVDAHDGSVQRFGSKPPFYMHAVQYGLCREPANYGCDPTPDHCGFQLDHNITVYTTDDLSSGSWKFVGNAIDNSQRPPGVVFRPHAVYNPNSKQYVLWWNYQRPDGQYAGSAAATSSTPEGPFKLQVEVVNVTRGNGGDYDLFVDDDGSGYVIYSAAFGMSIELLTPDYLHSTGVSAVAAPNGSNIFPIYFVEAPTLFKRAGVYYAVFGHCCCFCYQGSGLFVFTAAHPLGPWTEQPGGNIACVAAGNSPAAPRQSDAFQYGAEFRAIPTPMQGCQYQNASTTSATRSQQNFVIQVPTSNGTAYVYTGDRWQQAPDGLKGHDPQFWAPLQFNDAGAIMPLRWVDNFTLDVQV